MKNSPSHTEPKKVQIVPLDRFNWETCANLTVSEDQQNFIPDNIISIAQSKFEEAYPFGIFYGDKMVGFIMYSVYGGVYWVNRIMIDQASQRMGYGRRGLKLMMDYLRLKARVQDIRSSIHRENVWAQFLFQAQGFELIGPPVGDEVVMQWQPV